MPDETCCGFPVFSEICAGFRHCIAWLPLTTGKQNIRPDKSISLGVAFIAVSDTVGQTRFCETCHLPKVVDWLQHFKRSIRLTAAHVTQETGTVSCCQNYSWIYQSLIYDIISREYLVHFIILHNAHICRVSILSVVSVSAMGEGSTVEESGAMAVSVAPVAAISTAVMAVSTGLMTVSTGLVAVSSVMAHTMMAVSAMMAVARSTVMATEPSGARRAVAVTEEWPESPWKKVSVRQWIAIREGTETWLYLCICVSHMCPIFNRPGVAGAVLQTASSLTD